jgi:hypothetical protein
MSTGIYFPKNFRHGAGVGARAAGDVDRRLGIEMLALGLEPVQRLARIALLEQRTVAAPADAFEQGFDVAIEPDRDGPVQHQRPRFRIDEGPAAGREDLGRSVDQPGDHPALAVAEAGFAEGREDFRDRELGRLLDLVVGIDEGNA